MILTVDAGQSSTKIALISPSQVGYDVVYFSKEESQPSSLEERIIALVREDKSIQRIGIAVTHAISQNRELVFSALTGEEYLHKARIQLETGKETSFYNDAEAAAFSLNLNLQGRMIQAGNPSGTVAAKTSVYLGTGFQFTPMVYKSEDFFVPIYVHGCLASLPVNVLSLDEMKIVAEKSGKNISELGITDVVSAKGLENVHTLVSGKELTARELIESATSNQETFARYSSILGAVLRQIAVYSPSYHGITLVGTFASAIAFYIDEQELKLAFNNNEHTRLFRSSFERIPIFITTDVYSAHKGVAFAMNHGMETSANHF